MKKPGLPSSPRTPGREQFDTAVKETLEIITGRRGVKVSPITGSYDVEHVAKKLNELINFFHGGGEPASDESTFSGSENPWLSNVSGTNAVTADASPAPEAYVAGQVFRFVSAGTNTGPVTLNISSLGVRDVTKNGTTALAAGDIRGGAVVEVVFDGTRFQISNVALAMATSRLLGRTTAGAGAPEEISVGAGLSLSGGQLSATVSVEAGMIAWFPMSTAPSGYLKANGAAVSRATYSALFNALVKTSAVTISIASPGVVTWNNHGRSANDPIKFTTTGVLPTGLVVGTTYFVVGGGSLTTNSFRLSATPGGAAINTSGTQSGTHTAINAPFGDGNGTTTFNLPDLRGEFIRGWDDSRSVDSGRVFGSAQADDFKAHNHGLNMWNLTAFDATGGSNAVGADASGTSAGVVSGTTTITNTGGTETRPRNIALLACIKF